MESKKIIVLIVIILLILFLGLFVVYINRKSKERIKHNEERKSEDKINREKMKEENPEEFEKILEKESENKRKNKLWKDTRVGLFIFVGIHLIIEVIFSEGVGTGQPNPGVSVGFNYVISRYFIRRNIFNKNKKIDNPLIYGIGISLIVFCVRLLFGVLLYLSVS